MTASFSTLMTWQYLAMCKAKLQTLCVEIRQVLYVLLELRSLQSFLITFSDRKLSGWTSGSLRIESSSLSKTLGDDGFRLPRWIDFAGLMSECEWALAVITMCFRQIAMYWGDDGRMCTLSAE